MHNHVQKKSSHHMYPLNTNKHNCTLAGEWLSNVMKCQNSDDRTLICLSIAVHILFE
eukprot:m.80687 g.80687  ORF g.80687 m.80687 type:complete len:57 (-) comp12607_c0_seq2:1471-1641(-)